MSEPIDDIDGDVEPVDLEPVDLDGGDDDDEYRPLVRPAREPLPPYAIVAIVAIVAVVVATVAGGLLTRRQAAAATVDGHEVTRRAFERDLDAFVHNPALANQATTSGVPASPGHQYYDANGHIDAAWAAQWLQSLIISRIVDNGLEARHVVVAPSAIATARASLTQQLSPQLLRGFPSWFIDELARHDAASSALDKALGSPTPGQAVNAAIVNAVRHGHISVDPRYGRFDAKGTSAFVFPPTAPTVQNERSTSTAAATLLGG